MAGEDSNVSIGLEIEPVRGSGFDLLSEQAERFWKNLLEYEKKKIALTFEARLDLSLIHI